MQCGGDKKYKNLNCAKLKIKFKKQACACLEEIVRTVYVYIFNLKPVSPVVEDEGVLEATHLEEGVCTQGQSLRRTEKLLPSTTITCSKRRL